jgi:divalent metal cation (Fe/Co/Zn/Cd) transporter
LPLPLVERSEQEVAQAIKRKVEAMKDVRDCSQPSVRITGKRLDVEMQILLDSNLGFEDAHRIALEVEREVKTISHNARVTIHTEPLGDGGENLWRLVKEISEGVPGSRGAHNIHIQRIDDKIDVDLHLEVSANMTVKQAHSISQQVEKRIKAANPRVSEITVHMESASNQISRELAGVDIELKSYIAHVAKRFPEIKRVHAISVRRVGDALHLVLRCHFDPNLSMKKAHEASTKLDKAIKRAYPQIARIDIHEEPA